MKHHIFKILSFRKIGLSTAVILVLSGMSVMSTDASFKPNPLYPARNMITYEPPEWGTTGNLMSDADVVKRFSVLVYGHNQMKRYLPRYKSAGYNGDALLYLIADAVGGPQKLASTYAQSKTCAELGINPNLDVISAFATMDTGDLCEIHDAIAYQKRGVTDPNKICLVADGYPDICPTENWFVHKSDGSRYEKVRSGYSGYQPNPGDANWRKYFARRTLRELVYNYQPGYEFVSGIDGLFIDNLELSWSKVKGAMGTIKEYSSDCEYTKTVRDFALYVHSKLHDSAKGYNFPVWANMISDSTYDPCGVAANSWIPFENYLEGGLDESFILNWGNGPYTYSHAEREMNIGSYWSKKGKHYVATIQADNGPSYNMYAFAAYLMTTDGVNGSYKYSDNPGGAYSHYFTMPNSSYPDYNYPLGRPTGDKYLSNSSSHEWKRNFQCGQVTVNLTNYTGSINLISNCNPTSPTPTVRPTPTPTNRPTPTPTVRATPTPTLRPTSTPTPASGILISNLSVKDTGNAAGWSIQSNLSLGNLQYGDRTYTFTSVPSYYVGSEWLRTAQDSKSFTGDPLAIFTLKQAAFVYLAFDDGPTIKPAWLSAYTDTGDNLVNNYSATASFSLFAKYYPAGAIVNLSPITGDPSTTSMYTIVVKPPRIGDANANGKIDLLDYVTWLNHYNRTSVNGPTDGDFNSDAKVDLLDYVIWLNNFGK